MKVFISWSGPLGNKLAEALRQWLPGVIQAARPYYTPDDITKGARWTSEIAKELEESQVGIICVTRDSLEAPWIAFEAGALSKNIDRSRVCPILFNLKPSDVQGPLVQFQLAQFDELEMKRVVKMINGLTKPDAQLDHAVLEPVFDMWWPKLKENVEAILQEKPQRGNKLVLRPDRELLEEILRLSRIAAESNSDRKPGSELKRFAEKMYSQSATEVTQDFLSLVECCRSLGLIKPLAFGLADLSTSIQALFPLFPAKLSPPDKSHENISKAMQMISDEAPEVLQGGRGMKEETIASSEDPEKAKRIRKPNPEF